MSNRRTTGRARLWAGGVGTVAAAAAMIGMGTAHADDGSVPTDIGLLNTAESNVLEGFAATGRTDTVFLDLIGKLDAVQTPLLSSDNSFVSGFGEALFNGPDQQLEQSSETFLSASQAIAAEPTNLTALSDFASAGFQLDGAAFGEIPSTLIGKLTDQILGYDILSAGAATDLAASASSAAATATDPAGLLSEATNTLTSGSQVLDSIDVSGVNEQLAQTVSTQLGFDNHALIDIGNLASAENLISANDGGFSTVVNEVLTPIDQNIYQSTEAILAADQAFDVALSADPGGLDPATLLADIGLVAPDYQLLGEIINALPIDWIGNLF